MANLGKWALIDIETTGIDQNYDEIIDIGFLQFDGVKLVKTYSSLVHTEVPLTHFIQKLTGIKQKEIDKAPSWDRSEFELLTLEGHKLIAHNSSFEEKFLKKYFDKNSHSEKRETFEDSLYLLGLLFPHRSVLKLESFIVDFKLRDSEKHRGFEDSLDLLKVILVSVKLLKKHQTFYLFIKNELTKFSDDEFWLRNFIYLSDEELEALASSIDFDLEKAVLSYLEGEINEELSFQISSKSDFKNEFSKNNISTIFKSEDIIKKSLPFFKYRKPQEELALRVGVAFHQKAHSLVQAPTGTGKTLGYLIPSSLFSMSTNEQVLISTGTKALQNQAIEKDIPSLRKILSLSEENFQVTRLIGSSNHFCELKYRNSENDDLLIEMRSFEEKFSHLLIESYFFINSLEPKHKIIRDDVPYSLKKLLPTLEQIDHDIKVDYRSCSGALCPYKDSCSYFVGLKEAKEAKIIIGNHSLMFHWPRSLNRPRYVVVDEAHKIENEAMNSFSIEISQKDLFHFTNDLLSYFGPLFYLIGQFESTPEINVRNLRADLKNAEDLIKDHIVPLVEIIEASFKMQARYTSTYWNEIPMIGANTSRDQNFSAIRNHLESIHFILSNIYNSIFPYKMRYDLKMCENDKNKITAFTAFEGAFSTLEDYVKGLDLLLKEDEDNSRVIKFHELYGFILFISPINIGKEVFNNLLSPSESVIFTSATLANSKGTRGVQGIEWATGYSFLPPEKRFKSGLYLDEVFDYKNRAKVFLATDVPNLNEVHYVETILKDIIPLVKKIGGRTLFLFSSKFRFDQACEILLQKLDGECPLFIQGMGAQVVEDFKKADRGVLVGMESFGEGIDIPGDDLRFVVIDKIPDLKQDIATNNRKLFYGKTFGNEFVDYFLANRTRSLHQKLGRLLRRETDYGAALILDQRIKTWKGSSLGSFLDLMEPYNVEIKSLKESCQGVEEFLSLFALR